MILSTWRASDAKVLQFQNLRLLLVLHVNRLIECIHVHASDSRLTEFELAKFFVRRDGSTAVQKRGVLTDRKLREFRRS